MFFVLHLIQSLYVSLCKDFHIIGSPMMICFSPQDSTLGLEFNAAMNPYIQNYEDLFSHIDKCVAEGKGAAITFVIPILLILSSLFIKHYFNYII